MRQFQFEIRDLFGCSDKPFSCDVEIRYADQMTVIPIEVQACTWHYMVMPWFYEETPVWLGWLMIVNFLIILANETLNRPLTPCISGLSILHILRG